MYFGGPIVGGLRGADLCARSRPTDAHPFLHLPAGFSKMLDKDKYAWQFNSEPAP